MLWIKIKTADRDLWIRVDSIVAIREQLITDNGAEHVGSLLNYGYGCWSSTIESPQSILKRIEILSKTNCGMPAMVAGLAHTQEVAGSTPAPATKEREINMNTQDKVKHLASILDVLTDSIGIYGSREQNPISIHWGNGLVLRDKRGAITAGTYHVARWIALQTNEDTPAPATKE